jgi:hypothetical protein
LDGFLHSRAGGYGTHNFLGRPDADLDRLIERADRIVEPSIRRPALEEAVRRAQSEIWLLPLVVETRLAAVRPALEFTPRTDGIVRALDLRRAR